MTIIVGGEPWLTPRGLTALVAGSIILSAAAGGLYQGVGRPMPESVSALGNLLLSLSVIAWFRGYSRVRSIPWVFDMGTFLLYLWLVLVPYYVVSREGWRGVGRLALFVAGYVAASVVGGIVGRAAAG